MRLISRSVLREILPPFLLGLAAYTFIILVRTIVMMADFFVRRSATALEVSRLVLLSIPWIVVLTLPMAFLLGVLIGIGRLSADSELTAMRACGIGPAALYRPALGGAAALSLLVFLLYNSLLPWANEELTRSISRAAATSVINLVQPRTFREPRAGETLFFDRVGADNRSFEGVFLKVGEEPVDRVIVARRGALNLERDELWLDLFDSTVHEYDAEDPSRYRIYRNERQRILFAGDIWNEPRTRITYEKALRAQSLTELIETARKVKGRFPERYRLAWVEIHKKFAIPLACFVFAFVGIPLAERSRRAGRGGGFALSLAILVGYYVLLNSGETWAEEGKLPPAVAMWLPNALLLAAGLLAMRRMGVQRARWRLPVWMRLPRPAREQRERRSLFGEILTFPAILDRYVLRGFLSALLLVQLSIAVLSVVVDYADKVDEVLRHRPPVEVLLGYYRFFLLSVSMDIVPFGVLLATLIGLGVLSKNNEDTAFRASGVSLYRLGAPILIATSLGAVAAFTVGEYVLPFAKQREERYKHRIYGRPADYGRRTISERNWYYSRDGRIWHREATDPERGVLISPSVFEFDKEFQLVRRFEAREAVWQDGAWLLRQGWQRAFDGAREISYENFLEQRVAGDPPAAFARERRSPAEMRFRELQRHARRLKRSGYPTASLETALHAKLARPLLIPIMALLALPFAFRIGKRGALAGVGIGLALGIALIIGATFFTKLGEVGALPPLLAAWSPDVLFATAASYLLLKIRT